MELAEGFAFTPLFNRITPAEPRRQEGESALGPLAGLAGHWRGTGFNVIWRPDHVPGNPGQDRFLELNLTSEQLTFDPIPGAIPNRGLLQDDINMFGLTYLQQISDSNLDAGLHIEPGIWARVPETEDPAEPETVVRMASIPHGTTIVAQGLSRTVNGGPLIQDVSIKPFPIGAPGNPITFPEQDLGTATQFRTPANGLVNITKTMVDNPNSVLQAAIVGQNITSTIVLNVSTSSAPVLGGGTANTAFLQGGPDGPNAVAAQVSSIFWLETVQGENENVQQLQYTQTVLLNFNGLSWPHITVATLRKHDYDHSDH
jgi:hypothetical protein